MAILATRSFSLTAVLVVVHAACPTHAFAQLPSNKSLADEGVEPFATCARNSPATTTLTLSTRAVGKGATATTADPFFVPADTGRRIGLIGRRGLAKVTAVTDSTHAIIEITEGFGPRGPYASGTWGRWPFCYMSFTGTKYGFNTGAGHQWGRNTPRLVLDRGQQYSVDACSLAHDSKYWGPATDKSPKAGETQCNNNHWVRFCFTKIEPKTVEEEEALNSIGPVRPAFLPGFQALNFCEPKRGWIELPTSSYDIPDAAAACYGTEGQLILGLGDHALDVSGWNSANGAQVIVWHRNAECNQRWRMIPGTGNPARYGYEIRGLGGKCLGTAPGRRPRPGDLVRMWDCAGRYTEKWHYEHGQLRVQDRRTPRLCLDVKDDRAPGDVIVAKCASIKPAVNPSQQWRFAAP